MLDGVRKPFAPQAFLANAGVGRKIVHIAARQHVFTQGREAKSVFLFQKGHAKRAIVSAPERKRRSLCCQRGASLVTSRLQQSRASVASSDMICESLCIKLNPMLGCDLSA
jgi:hypothetical protein